MVSWKKHQCLFGATLLAYSSLLCAGSGNTSGGGGITIAANFATTGRQAIALLSIGDKSLDLTSITDSIKNVKVVPVSSICYQEPLLGKQYCEDAHYDSANNIVLLDFKNWNKKPCVDKLVLSAHEFFRAAGLEGEDYKYSGRFIYRDLIQCLETSSEEQERCADLEMIVNRKLELFCEQIKADGN